VVGGLLGISPSLRAYVYREFSYQILADRFDNTEEVRKYVYENASVLKSRKAWPFKKEAVIYTNPWYYLERGMAFCDQLDVLMAQILRKKGTKRSFVVWYIDRKKGTSPHSILYVEDEKKFYDPLVEEGILLPMKDYNFRLAMLTTPSLVDSLTRWSFRIFGPRLAYIYQDFYLWMLGPEVPSVTKAMKHYGPPAMELEPKLLFYYKAINYQLYGRKKAARWYYYKLINVSVGEEDKDRDRLARRFYYMMYGKDGNET